MDKKAIQELKTELKHFTGSEQFYRPPLFSGYVYTEGVQYLAEKTEVYWLVDYIFSSQLLEALKTEPF